MAFRFARSHRRVLALAVALGSLAGVSGAAATASTAKSATTSMYVVRNLVSDGTIPADHTDPNLVNAWGLAEGPTSPWWVANNGTDTSTLYDANGVPQFQPTPLVVKVEGGPTGAVFNGGSGFVVSDNRGHSGPARFMFATEDGKIRGWNPNVPPPSPSTHAVVGANRSGANAIYKGLAIDPAAGLLYATDFHNSRIDVFDSSFHLVHPAGGFVDPALPPGYGPFGIQDIGGNVFVTYAKQDADRHDDVPGHGLGVVDEYTTDGTLVTRVATGGDLNAPWGLAMAPSDFGQFSSDLLVGNFGDGRIHAFKQQSNGSFTPDGVILGTNGKPITIDGLWGIGFGNGSTAGPTNTLYFASGPDDEAHGLFGRIDLELGGTS